MHRLILILTFSLYANSLLAEDIILPIYGTSCSELESFLEDRHTIYFTYGKKEGYLDYYKEPEMPNPYNISYSCIKDRLYYATIVYTYNTNVAAIEKYNMLKNIMEKRFRKPGEKNKADESPWPISYDTYKQMKMIERGEMDEEEFFDFAPFKHEWVMKYGIYKLDLSRSNTREEWWVFHIVTPNWNTFETRRNTNIETR